MVQRCAFVRCAEGSESARATHRLKAEATWFSLDRQIGERLLSQ